MMEHLIHASLLRTKLLFPTLRRSIIHRPRLVNLLEEGLKKPFTLISAPAGYGKSTLLSEWRAGPGKEIPVAWLSLDDSDNDLPRFWLYLVSALNTIQEGLADEPVSMLNQIQLPPIEILLTFLINDLISYSQDFVLVLDDVHIIKTSEIHQMLAYLLDHLPPQMHLVILTRADPPLPIARMRVGDQLVEIRQKDLQFTPEEAATFLKDVMGLRLKADDVETLMERTEGWIAGLQLAALSIQGQEDPSEVIATFGGGYQYLVDYLVQEVLSRQPDPLRLFLLHTSILDRLSGPLCDALTQQSEGEAMLGQLEQANLFVTQLGGECCWYRYHHLFVDVTRSMLRQEYPHHIPDLHRRAARWYGENGFFPEAIKHALAAKDWEHAGSLLAAYSSVAWRSGEVTRLLAWVKELPEEVLLVHPGLSINYAWACVLTGKFEECDELCTQIEPLIRARPELQIDWLTVRVFLARARGQQERAVELAHEAQEYHDRGGVDTRALLMLSLTIALWDLGRVKESAVAAEEASHLAERAKNWHAWALMQSFIGLAQAASGNLRLAKEIYQRVTQQPPGIPKWVGGGFAQVCLSALFYEWDELQQALEYALTGLEYSEITGLSEIQMNCYRQLAFIYQAQKRPQKAQNALDQAEKVVKKHQLPRLWGPEHIQIALAQKDLVRAQYWSEQVYGEYGAAIHYPAIPLEKAKLTIAKGDSSAAVDLLTKSYQKATRDGIRYAQIEIRILQSLAATDDGQAMDYFCEALAWAEAEGFCRIFVDQGEALKPLLRKAAQMGFYPSYAVQLLTTIEMESDYPQRTIQPLLEPLSDREMQVLQLVVAGKSNQEIADELVIALGTVKRHIYNIFGKLNVRSRTQCAARAQELNLLK